MKPIKITTANVAAIQAAIDEAQGRATARTINSADVDYSVSVIEKRLSDLLLKKDWVGLRVIVDPNAQSFPGAYRFIPESTNYTVERRASGWFLTRVERGICGGPSHRYNVLGLKEKANEIAAFVSQHFA